MSFEEDLLARDMKSIVRHDEALNFCWLKGTSSIEKHPYAFPAAVAHLSKDRYRNLRGVSKCMFQAKESQVTLTVAY